MVTYVVQLALAHAGEGQREEHQEHGLLAPEIAQGDGLVVLVAQGEIGGDGANRQH
ncbi:Uncharacterised protein [Mycobacteroides abscessus subsp. massiliense]|nr:Uncharacterised protein [Mycobacteroides abscessus subsp. massiliense]